MLRHRIVIVDDEPFVRELVVKRLQAAGHETWAAPDGESGVKLIRQVRPGLAILDRDMPGLGGLEVLATLRSDPRLSDTRFMMLTAERRAEEIKAALNAGASDYLVKPFTGPELLARVRRCLERAPVTWNDAAPPASNGPDDDRIILI